MKNYSNKYFDSNVEFNSKKGLYKLRNNFSKNGFFIKKNSDYHYSLMLKDKWRFLNNCRRVLDIGFGRGQFMKTAPPSIDMYGIDVVEKEVIDLKKQGYKVKFCDVTKDLPYKDSFFDGVTMFHILEHLGEPEEAIKNIKRVLVNRGIILIAVPNFKFKDFYKDYTHKRPFPPEALYRILADNDFYDIKIIKGAYLNKYLSALFLFFPRFRYSIEKLIGKISPWEYMVIAKNEKN